MTATITRASPLAYKCLVPEGIWERLVSRIVIDESTERPYAERVMNEALGFLYLCAASPDKAFSPSPAVDVGWHTFLLYTREYAEFCRQHAGRFIHHQPTDVADVTATGLSVWATREALGILGPVDGELWTSCADCNTGCSSSCSGGSCRS